MMTKNGEEYFRTLLNAQRRGLQKLTKQQQIKIEKIYEQVFQDAYRDFINGKKNLTNKKYQNQMKAAYIQQLYKELKSLSNDYNIKISKLTEDFHDDFLSYVIPNTEKTAVYTAYMEIVKKATKSSVSMMLKGNIYKDNLGLDDRLWKTANVAGIKLNDAVMSCVAKGMSSIEMSQVVVEFAKEGHKTWDRKKIREKLGPGYTRYGSLDYESLRLARTTNNHLNHLNTVNAAKANPYMNTVIYRTGHTVAGRTCEICKSRDGKIYKLDEAPFDHPNGFCFLEPCLSINGKEATLEDVGRDIGKWIRGEPNSGLMDKKYKV